LTTPKLQMPELVVGQAGKELTHNQALAILDQLTQATVVDKDLASPPGSPANGSMYIVAAAATGAWSGQSGKLAVWLTTVAAWTFITPANGWSVWVTDEAKRYELLGGIWTIVASGGGGGTAPGQNLLYNSLGNINQRGYVSGTATTIANQYTIDRYRVVVSGQNLSFTASGNGFIKTAPAGGVEQVIEGINISGGNHAISWTGTATASVNGTARTNGEVFNLPANTNAVVRFTSGTFQNEKVELGSAAAAVVDRPYGQEIDLCRRYCRPVSAQILGSCISSTSGAGYMALDTPMRATPTLSSTSGATMASAAGAPLAATISINSMFDNNLRIDGTVSSGLVAGNSTVMIFPATTFISAEI
jgi:hypothetical protein